MSNKNKFFIIFVAAFIIIFSIILKSMIFPSGAHGNTLVLIPPNSSVKEIANILYSHDVIKSPLIFKIIVKISGAEHKLKAGEYEFDLTGNMFDVLKKINNGEFKKYPITIPEGFTAVEIATLLESKQISNKSNFLLLIKDKKILNKYKIDADSLEGYLFPDTYFLFKGISEEKIIENMVEHFFNVFNDVFEKRCKEINLTRHEVVTLASIVEKEAKIDKERKIIAAVFLNRIKKNMKLESCATVLYALGMHKIKLFDEDLKIDSLYNTYRYDGLPPGPISNPGLDSIKAVLYPDEVDYLFFVSRNDGTHEFTNNFQEHVRNKNKYLR